ncbi:polyprenyl synthetase family protein [Protofrankia sp. BMG5.30]|uniref:polyprenyl synthetase family protein n=1 Tax=Protofrankia sp. BMG5.30 TaxID=1834514 RepID=UPI0009771A05|nr:polyprenyl synthetase family protein [Protofrankia sp. BMG5.30]ONH34242.1 polyprenyl diphosphate synthase [Protofrankia sp. BMG5.30]
MSEYTPPLRVTSPAALDTLARCRDLVLPALRETIDRLHPWLGRMASFTFDWCDSDGTPTVRGTGNNSGGGNSGGGNGNGGGGGGKALRPALAVLAAEAVGAPAQAAVAGAVAVELVHAFSLVHDDIMDGDERRRHRATAWKAFGVGPAVLAGDALLALALDTLAHSTGRLAPATRSAAMSLLSTSLVELVNGQAADIAFEYRPWTGPDAVTVEEYRTMATRKTGSLLGCASALGALLGGAPPEMVTAMSLVGRDLGTAFQAVDDLLGIWGDPAVTGKPVFNDLRLRKKTLPVICALAGSTASAQQLADLLAMPLDTPDAEWTLRRTAALISKAGGRSFTTAQAHLHLDRALRTLDSAAMERTAAAELITLSEFVVNRTH